MRILARTAALAALLALASGCGRGQDSPAPPAAGGPGATGLEHAAATHAGTDTDCVGPCPMDAGDSLATYVLVEMNGHRLPDTTYYSPPGEPGRRCTAVNESDTLFLRKGGSSRTSGRGRNWCNDMPTPIHSATFREWGTFTLGGARHDSIFLSIDLDPPAREEGVFIGDELRLATTSEPNQNTFRYVRLRR